MQADQAGVQQQHTHTRRQTKQVGGQAGGQGGERTWGAQRMSSGPMLDARQAGQAGETGQADQAGVQQQHTHVQPINVRELL